MGLCFKLFGQTIVDEKITDCTGSTFYVAEHYLLTCKHLVSALSPGDKLSFCYGKNEYSAVLEAFAVDFDLALLYTEQLAQKEWIYPLDRVALVDREAVAYGYPDGYGLDEQRGLKIGTELDKEVPLTNANGVTIGFSGGPVCHALDLETAIGVISTITGVDKYGRRSEGANFVPVRIALELWGEQYGLLEKHFKIKPNAFGSNKFVYSAQRTAFQDIHGYLNMLRGFIEDSRPVLWWAIVGLGGSGKSRLCYEFACSLNSNWRCELVRAGQLKKDHLQKLYEDAGRNFLLIADYAYTDTDELGEWLVERSYAYNGPVIRVLLLQRENGKEYFGWLESLLRCHRNLIEHRYQEDLQLCAPGREDIIAIMCSYAENEGGGQIDIPGLYTVLQNIDPGLNRPLFAMFITDAALHGEDPRGWDPEKALAYFTRREKDIVDRALNQPEDAHVAKLLLLLATIANGFAFDADMLDEKPLCELQAFSELSEKASFGRRLSNARLADWEHGHYIVKPLKPDLLGEYYVLSSCREMMNDIQQKEIISFLLSVARMADPFETGEFFTRLFTDFKTDELVAQLCCGYDYQFHYDVSWGLVMRPDTVLLRKLYEIYGTELWLEQYAKGLYNEFNYQTEPEKAIAILDELRQLYGEQPENGRIVKQLAKGLVNCITMFSSSMDCGKLLNELRELHMKQPENYEVTVSLAVGLFNCISWAPSLLDMDCLLDELRQLHKEESWNEEIGGVLARGLFRAFNVQTEPKIATALLDELSELHREYPEYSKVTEWLAKGLYNEFMKQTGPAKAGVILDEIRELQKEQPCDSEVAGILAIGLFSAMHQTELKKAYVLLDEMRKLQKEQPWNFVITHEYARGLFNAIQREIEPDKVCLLLDGLHELHREQPGIDMITKILACSLFIISGKKILPVNADALLEELRELYKKMPGDTVVCDSLKGGIINLYNRQTDPEKAEELLDELRKLQLEQSEDDC